MEGVGTRDGGFEAQRSARSCAERRKTAVAGKAHAADSLTVAVGAGEAMPLHVTP